jgi:hypothetical protein
VADVNPGLYAALYRPIPDVSREERLEELIRWLANPYQANRPQFRMYVNPDNFADGHYEPTPLQLRLEETWEEVVGPLTGPVPPGGWARCQCCGMWQVIAEVKG